MFARIGVTKALHRHFPRSQSGAASQARQELQDRQMNRIGRRIIMCMLPDRSAGADLEFAGRW
jgi:hypothetical protein